MKNWYRLPCGNLTQDFEEYAKAWQSLAKPICDLTGAELNGFDPDIQIIWNTDNVLASHVIHFPPSFLKKLNEALSNEGVLQK